MFKHILVPTDGSELSTKTVVRAVKFAKETGAKVTFYYAKPDYATTIYAGGAYADLTILENFRKIVDEQAEQILAACEKLAQEAGVTYARVSTVNSIPYRGVIEVAAANGCDLIFMASHGRHGLNAVLLGSETHKVLTHTSIPVLVYR